MKTNTPNTSVTKNVTSTVTNTVTLDPFDLSTTQGNIKGLVTCLNDVGVIISLALKAEHQSTAHALLRTAQIAVEQWAEVGQSEVEFLDGFLKGTAWELGGNV